MDSLQIAVPYTFFCILVISHVSLAQDCELSFHTEAESLMLLEGRSGSVVCDGTCFGGGGDVVFVFWTDMLGKKVPERGESLYSVPHQQNLLSQLVVKNATSQLSRTFTCSVVKGGRLVQSKSMSVIIFERHPPRSRLFPQVPRGPRRGDQLIPADISNRPVRSVKMPSGSHGVSQAGAIGGGWRSSGGIKVAAQDNGLDLVDVDYDTQEDRDYAAMELLEALAWRKKMEKVKSEKPLPGSYTPLPGSYTPLPGSYTPLPGSYTPLPGADTNVILHDRRSQLVGRGPVNHELPAETHRLSENLASDLVSDRSENEAILESSVFSFSLSRHRRDDQNVTDILSGGSNTSMTETTSEGESIEINVTTTQTSTTTLSTTSSTTTTAEDPTPQQEITSDKGVDPVESGNSEGNPPCTASPEPTNFGKYGILAFAVSLSLAFLLLYAILMILFMPRILARKRARRKSDLEAPIYRKKHSDIGEIPPMPINLNDTTPSDIDLGDAKQTKDLHSSLTSQSTNEDDAKKEDAGPAVSTFLLRQASVNKKENESCDTKDSAAANDKVTEEIIQNKTDASAPEKPEDVAKPPAEVGGLLNNILSDFAENRPETKNDQEAIGGKAETKSNVRESDFDLPPFPDPDGSDLNKDIIDV